MALNTSASNWIPFLPRLSPEGNHHSDDGSTDDTIAICQAYQEKYPIVHFSRNEHNLGFNANFKSAAMKATGDFVAFSDQDDVWFPTKIEKQVAAIGNHDICFSTHLRGLIWNIPIW